MTTSPRVRRFILTIHLVFSVGWVGAGLAYLALGVFAATSGDAATVRGAWIAMELIGWSAIVPLALGTLLTGLLISLVSPWGLIQHYWVVITLVLTAVAVAVTVLHMPAVSSMADAARGATSGDLGRLGGDLLHPGVGLVVLLVIMVLNVYKPKGRTRYGRREQHRRNGTLVP